MSQIYAFCVYRFDYRGSNLRIRARKALHCCF
ncbi:uncharacterized protein METZ01_LOCUS393502 [marine metagenome]|uniref:Uncharacterized protein n=1 Tax=marine metagenome TaxID=408172 RepID=A0A382V3Z9_9ZZZZ